MTKHPSDLAGETPAFDPVPTKPRHDGWSPERQHDFIAALAETACVAEAAAAVGKTVQGAYRLRARPDASAFRQAWDIALDYAVRRLGDAALGRALHGVARPVFYQGEQIGERRHFDERLTMFLLRYRDPTRFGAWLDGYEARRHPDGAGIVLAYALNAVMDSAHGIDPDPDDPGRPLAEGPAPAADADSGPGGDGADTHHTLLRDLRAYLDRDDPGAEPDPAVADGRDPFTALRPRTPKYRGDVP